MQKGGQGKVKPGERLLIRSVDVVLWAIAQRRPITRQAIQDRWHVHKSTAWRWKNALEEARQRAMNMPRPQATNYRTPHARTSDSRALRPGIDTEIQLHPHLWEGRKL